MKENLGDFEKEEENCGFDGMTILPTGMQIFNDENEIKLTKFEKLQEKHKEAVFSTAYKWLDKELDRNEYYQLDSFVVGESIFVAYMKADCFLYVQLDKQGRNFRVYKEIDFTRKEDIILKLAKENGAEKVLHTQIETRKNVLTKVSNFILKLEKVFYDKN